MTRKIIFAVPSALILLAYVIGMAWVSGGSRMQLAVNQEGQAVAAQHQVEPKVEFIPKGVLDYLDDRGFRGSRQIFQSMDGVGVELTTEWRDSSEEADRALEEGLRAASRVIERSPLLSKEGQRFGDRALAYSPAANGGGEERPALLRTDGATFYHLDSSSLRHLLLLERELFDSKPRAREHTTPTGLRPGAGREQ